MSAAAEVLRICEKYEEEFPSLLHDAPYAFLLCRRDGTITATNPAIAQFLGATPNHRPGKRFPDLIPADKRAEAERFLRSLFDGERHGFQIDTETSQSDRHALRWTAWLVQGEAPAVLVMAEEIPEKLFAQQRLRQSQRLEAIGRLAGGVAHDFNNLLTGILLYCDLLVAGSQAGSRLRHHAEEIRMAGEQGAALIQHLLAISRRQVVEPLILCLNQTIESTRNLLSRLIGENIELHLQLQEELGNVKMDPAQAQQIFFNLVLNARDAIADGGRIT